MEERGKKGKGEGKKDGERGRKRSKRKKGRMIKVISPPPLHNLPCMRA